jgi:hypothetical protein
MLTAMVALTGCNGISGVPTCEQYAGLSASEQEKAIERIQSDHDDHSPSAEARFSVELFCRIYPSHKIDGIYDGSL